MQHGPAGGRLRRMKRDGPDWEAWAVAAAMLALVLLAWTLPQIAYGAECFAIHKPMVESLGTRNPPGPLPTFAPGAA